jgi:hypothetical protein
MAATTPMNRFVEQAVRVFAGAVFVYAGSIKAIDPARFFYHDPELSPDPSASSRCCGILSAVAGGLLWDGADISASLTWGDHYGHADDGDIHGRAGFSPIAWAKRRVRLFRRGISFGIQRTDCWRRFVRLLGLASCARRADRAGCQRNSGSLMPSALR